MRGFHVVFEIRILGSGVLTFLDDDGCVIRRNGEIVHSDCSAHSLRQSEIPVDAGDRLEIAHWQLHGDWVWGARLESSHHSNDAEGTRLLLPYLQAVQKRLIRGSGPPLKMFVHGHEPLRSILAVYSIILNGYQPSEVILFGECQWNATARDLFSKLLPFARIVPTVDVLAHLENLGGADLAALARHHPLAMKACVNILYPPGEFCFVDDDVLVLASLDSALNAFRDSDLVFAPDYDYEKEYRAMWGSALELPSPLPTCRINTGFFCLRNSMDAHLLAKNILRVPIDAGPSWQWEQGYVATQFSRSSLTELSSQQYFYPYFDGLPGGILGYDYAQNPCGFVTIHFGGLAEKPSDMTALILAPEILRKRLTQSPRTKKARAQFSEG